MSGLTDYTNPYIWMGMGPYAWSSNYGFEMQLNVLPEYATPQEARLFHGILNPNHISQWNPMFAFPIQSNVTNPGLTQQGLQQAYDWGKNRMAEIMDGINFNDASKNIGTIKGQFEALLKDKNLNDEQKAEIQKILPHRYPMLLIDQVDELIPGKKAIARRNVTINEEVFNGHFPKNPVLPGALIVESLAQTGAVALLSQEEFQGKTAYFGGIRSAEFRKVVRPGDTLKLEVNLEKVHKNIGIGKGIATVDGKKACTAELTFMIG